MNNIAGKIERYNVAALAAANGVITTPARFPFLAALRCNGTTGITLHVKGDAGSLGDSLQLPMANIPVETDDATQVIPWIPINAKMAAGEKIDILGTSLTLAAEVSVYAHFASRALGRKIRYKRMLYTNTTDNETLDPLPRDARDLVSICCRGVDLEATEFLVGGESIGWIKGTDATALNAIARDPLWQPIHVSRVAGQVLSTGQNHHGAGGASDVFVGYTI